MTGTLAVSRGAHLQRTTRGTDSTRGADVSTKSDGSSWESSEQRMLNDARGFLSPIPSSTDVRVVQLSVPFGVARASQSGEGQTLKVEVVLRVGTKVQSFTGVPA